MNQEAQQSQAAESDCDRIRRYVQEYLDGELEESLIVSLRVHIEMCKPCGRRVAFEAAFLRTIARGKNHDAAPTVVAERCAALLTEWRNKLA